MWNYLNLDNKTREYMLLEINHDVEHNCIYISTRLSPKGQSVYLELFRTACTSGDGTSFAESLRDPSYWNAFETRIRQGKPYTAKLPSNKEEVLAQGEFNVFYMRGLAARVLSEGGGLLEVYRAKQVSSSRVNENVDVGDQFSCEEILDDLRNRESGASRLGLPRGPASGLSLRRVQTHSSHSV